MSLLTHEKTELLEVNLVNANLINQLFHVHRVYLIVRQYRRQILLPNKAAVLPIDNLEHHLKVIFGEQLVLLGRGHHIL